MSVNTDVADAVVDTCLLQLPSNSSELDLVRCVTSSFSAELSGEFWEFSRNILLVYSTALVFYMYVADIFTTVEVFFSRFVPQAQPHSSPHTLYGYLTCFLMTGKLALLCFAPVRCAKRM